MKGQNVCQNDEVYQIVKETPFGFMQHVEKSTVLRPCRDELKLVQKMFQLCISGMSLGQITEYVNEQDIAYRAKYKKEIGVKWSMAEIKKILQDEIYSNKTFKVVSEREFVIAQRMLLINTRVAEGKLEISSLVGVARCAQCGGLMVERSTSSRGRKYCYYMCETNKRTGGCTPHKVAVTKLDNSVIRWLKNHVFDEDVQRTNELTRKLVIRHVDCVHVDEKGEVVDIILV